jgi:hypothetical protein
VILPIPTPAGKIAQTTIYPDEKALRPEEGVKDDEIMKCVIHAPRLHGELTVLDLPSLKNVSSNLRPIALDSKSRVSFEAKSHLLWR